MAERGKNIAKLNMEINRDELKKIVESGRLMEFADKASSLAAEEIKAQIFEELAKSALGSSQAGIPLAKNLMVNVAVSLYNDDYGTFCRKIGPIGINNINLSSVEGALVKTVASGIAASGIALQRKTNTEGEPLK